MAKKIRSHNIETPNKSNMTGKFEIITGEYVSCVVPSFMLNISLQTGQLQVIAIN